MALGVRTTTSAGSTTGTSDRSVAASVQAGDLIVVCVDLSDNTNTSMTCSDDQGGTYTLIATALYNASTYIIGAFVRNALAASTATHTITVASGSNTAGELCAVMMTGVTQVGSAAIQQSGTIANQPQNTTPTVTLGAAAKTSNIMIGLVGATAVGPTISPPTGWTEQVDAGLNTPNTGLEVATKDSGFSSSTVTWGSATGTGVAYAAIAIEISTVVNATLSSTLDAMTASGTVALKIQGTASITLGAMTLDAGIHKIQGTLTAAGAGTTCTASAIRINAYTLPSPSIAVAEAADDNPQLGEFDISVS